ncbi:MAG: DUF4388 domain-containing protein [Desulfuromonadales bacterium]|nr:DUF4388 domain-containing protein [Desulfuromonadales bacterium]
MPRSVQIALLFILWLTVFASPALARMVIGVTPAVTPGVGDPAVRGALEGELSSRLGETVVVRSFASEAAVLDWLIRFRELDAALVGRSLVHTLPAGTLLHLADLPPAVAVTHPGIAAGQHETLSRAFRSLFEDERGRQVLSRLASTAKIMPPPKVASAQRATQPALKPAGATPAVTAPLKTVPVPSAPTPSPVVISKPAALPTAAAAPPLQSTTALPPAKTTTASPLAKIPAKQTVPAKPQSAMPTPALEPSVEPTGRKRTGLLLIAALVIMIGISIKITLLMRHWQQNKVRPATPPVPPSAETFNYQGVQAHSVSAQSASAMATAETNALIPPGIKQPATSAAAATESSASMADPAPIIRPAPKRKTAPGKTAEDVFPPTDDLVVEQGRLGKVKIPALFKRCAELPQPVVLRVRAGDNETSVHFAAGQICHASSRNWRSDGEARQWSKLGYLMVRDGVLSEAQRDQTLELIERQPGLRFTAALQQLGILDLEALRHILARQAKTTIYSLILFSSGEYRIETDSGSIPAEESIALQVEALLREASHHQAEWTAIRKVLPNLGTRLDFTPDGREKLEQVRLSVHQQLLLSQVDGQTQIGTLCCDSTMMDYEACRFLYLMVKAGVLQAVLAA